MPEKRLSSAGLRVGGQGSVIGPWRLRTLAAEHKLKICFVLFTASLYDAMELKLYA